MSNDQNSQICQPTGWQICVTLLLFFSALANCLVIGNGRPDSVLPASLGIALFAMFLLLASWLFGKSGWAAILVAAAAALLWFPTILRQESVGGLLVLMVDVAAVGTLFLVETRGVHIVISGMERLNSNPFAARLTDAALAAARILESVLGQILSLLAAAQERALSLLPPEDLGMVRRRRSRRPRQ